MKSQEQKFLTVPLYKFNEKTKVPFIKVTQNGKPFLFLVDTGSDLSSIRQDKENELEYVNKYDFESYTNGEGGAIKSSAVCNLEFFIDKVRFREIFKIDESRLFKGAKSHHDGYEVYGILGTEFFRRNNVSFSFMNESLTIEINDTRQNIILTND